MPVDFPANVTDLPDANVNETLFTMHGSIGHVPATNRILANIRALAVKLGINNGTGPPGTNALLRRTANNESAWGKGIPADLTGPGAGSANTVFRTQDGTVVTLSKVVPADMAGAGAGDANRVLATVGGTTIALQKVTAAMLTGAGAADANKILATNDGTVVLFRSIVASDIDVTARIPFGAVMPFAGLAPPAGWLLCYGQAVSRTTYANLFGAITLVSAGNTNGTATISNIPAGDVSLMAVGMPITGTNIPAGATIASIASGTSITISASATGSATGGALRVLPFGVGDGSTTFGVPDLRGRVAAGRDNMGGGAVGRLTLGGSGIVGTTLGNAAGAENVTLQASQMPAHFHQPTGSAYFLVSNYGTRGPANTGVGSVQNENEGFNNTTTSTGGGLAHINTQPTIMLNSIIYAGV